MTSGRDLSNLEFMDTMKFLLGATAALLLGAIVVAWQGMERDKTDPAQAEQMKKLELEIERLKAQNANPQTPPSTEQAANPPSQQATMEALQRQLAEQQAADELRKAQEDAELRQAEDGLMAQMKLEQKDAELRRARLIAQALLVGKVTDYVDDPQYGGFITIEMLKPELIQVGSVLGIRRNNTGILYQFKVSDVSPEGAIANPVTAIGDIKPAKGDELIFPPLR